MNKIFRVVGKHIPDILTGAGVVGTVTTAVFSARGHVKAVDILRKAEGETGEPLETKEKVKKTWKCYIPAAGTGLLTIACIVGSNRVSAKNLAALGVTAGYLAKNRDQIKAKLTELTNKIKEEHPELLPVKVEKEEKHDLMRDVYQVHTKNDVLPAWEYTGKGTLRVVDLYSGRCFLSSKEAVIKAGQELNSMFNDGFSVCLSDWYALLGIKKTTFGFDFGWPNNADYFDGPIHFEYNEELDEDGFNTLFVDIWTPPMDYWQEL